MSNVVSEERTSEANHTRVDTDLILSDIQKQSLNIAFQRKLIHQINNFEN